MATQSFQYGPKTYTRYNLCKLYILCLHLTQRNEHIFIKKELANYNYEVLIIIIVHPFE